MKIAWANIDGLDGYQASSIGEIRSLDRIVDFKFKGKIYPRRKRGKNLKQSFAKNTGYNHFTPCTDKKLTMTTHRAVWTAFNGAIPNGLCINHINGIKTDNRLENLELCSARENAIHAIKCGNGARASGMRNRLSNADVSAIRFFYVREYGKSGRSAVILGKIFNRSPSTIQQIAYGNSGDFEI